MAVVDCCSVARLGAVATAHRRGTVPHGLLRQRRSAEPAMLQIYAIGAVVASATNRCSLVWLCASEMVATAEEMRAARIDPAFRDYCAHLLIPLNECRHRTAYLPWKCGHERHEYEKCQYGE